uniref:DUF659 domain-containing protein n=1 Tax=Amphimedon queenslandica TaxID=400682 RepID=A0A1X7SHK7_AMPQE
MAEAAEPKKKLPSILDNYILPENLEAEDLLPLSTVESISFRALLSSLDPRYSVPSRKHLSSVLIRDRCSELYDSVKEHLKDVKELSLTMDIWSNRQMRSYTGITAHYISNWKLQSLMLSCNRFKGSHTGEKIFQEYEDTVTYFGISSKVRHVVTDHASNMLKAFHLPGYEGDRDSSDDEEEEEEEDIQDSCSPNYTTSAAH